MEEIQAIAIMAGAAAAWWGLQFLAWLLILPRGGDSPRLRRSLLVFGVAAPVFVLLTLGTGELLGGRKIGTETLATPAFAGLVVFISWLGLITASKVKRSHK